MTNFFAWAEISNNEQYGVPRKQSCNKDGEKWE